MKISVEQLKQLNKEEYILIDIRDAEEAFKNPIENSIVLSGESVLSKEFDSTKKNYYRLCSRICQRYSGTKIAGKRVCCI